MASQLQNLFPDVTIDIVDIGANAIESEPPYIHMLRAGRARVVGFEPNPVALDHLLKLRGPHETYLPYAVGDGTTKTLNLCLCSGMTSVLTPNQSLLQHFHGFSEWARIERRMEIETKRLDDIAEITAVDMLKIDIQGYELEVFRNAPKRLEDTLVIHTEVEFLPMYENQPLFADVDTFLREKGFLLHKFDPLTTRTLRPMTVGGNIFKGLGQLMWADAVYVRDFRKFDDLSPEKLAKLAVILHELYGSCDVSLRALMHRDAKLNRNDSEMYLKLLN